MEVTAIGDIHGRDNWKSIIEITDTEHVVFAWDYFDSPSVSGNDQLHNFLEILEFQGQTNRRVTLLLGNHDFHYFPNNPQEYSWYGVNNIDVRNVWKLLQETMNDWKVQVVRQIDNVLYSHAGVTNEWCDDHDVNIGDIQESINTVFVQNSSYFQFLYESKKGPYRSWEEDWNDTFQSPLWVRPQSLERDAIKWIKQIVGHTQQACVTLSHSEQIAYIDTLGRSGEYLLVEDGNFQIQGRDFLSISEYVEVMKLFEEKKRLILYEIS